MDGQSKLEVLVVEFTESIQEQPDDMIVTAAFAVFAAALFSTPYLRSSPLTPVVGLPLLLFFPGYTVVAVLFPHGEEPATGSATTDSMGSRPTYSVDLVERLALSFGVSVALLPPLSLLWWTVGLGLSLAPVALAILVFLGSLAGSYRRLLLPTERRFQVPYRHWIGAVDAAVSSGRPVSRLVNITLLLAVLFASTALGYALVVPNSGETYSSLYLATENETGDLIASDYPTEFTLNESRQLVVGVQNHEQMRSSYVVVVELQRVETDGTSVTVREETELHRFSVTIEPNERWNRRHTLAPTMAGENLRVQYLLYEGAAPNDASADTAYRTAYLWINVSAATRTGSRTSSATSFTSDAER